MARLVSAAVCLFGSTHQALAAKVGIQNGVYVLDNDSFDNMVAKYQAVMVNFHSPTCPHCQAIASEYEKAAKKARKANPEAGPEATSSVRLAKVDATIETKLAERFKIAGFPTLLVFKDGTLFGEYTGPRTKPDILNHMKTVQMPTFLGAPLRVYYLLLNAFKDLLRPVLPVNIRKPLYSAFPFILVSPIVFTILVYLMCCRTKAAAPVDADPATRGRERAPSGGVRSERSKSPAAVREDKIKKDSDEAKEKDAATKKEE